MAVLEIHRPAAGQLDPKWRLQVVQHSARLESIVLLFQFHPNFQKCPPPRWACGLIMRLLAVEPLVSGSRLIDDPFLVNFSLLEPLLVAEPLFVLASLLAAEQQMKT